MSGAKKVFFISLALNLVPAVAIATETIPAAKTPNTAHELDLAEANEVFRGFRIVLHGNREAHLAGKIYSECADKYEFSSLVMDDGRVGFRITDKGGGLDCVKGFKVNGKYQPTENAAVSLSALPGTKVSLPTDRDGRVGLFFYDFHNDEELFRQIKGETGDSLAYESQATINKRVRDQLRQQREEEVSRLRNQISDCRKNNTELAIARRAAGQLKNMFGALTTEDFEQIMNELSTAELEVIRRKLAKTSVDDLGDLREELHAWADRNPEGNHDKVAQIYHKIALKYVNSEGAGNEAHDEAKATIEEALELDNLSDANRARLRNYLTEIEIGRVRQLAQHGMQGNYAFYASYQKLMNKLMNDTVKSCSGRSMENCASKMGALRSAQQLPTEAQQIDQQRAQMYQQIFGQMSQSSSSQQQGVPGQQPGMPGQSGMPVWGNGQMYGSTNPFSSPNRF